MLVFLILGQIVALFVAVEILANGIPSSLRKAMKDNCYRLNGQWSERRAKKESKAIRKYRRDLWAVGLFVCIAVSCAAVLIHVAVISLPNAGAAAVLIAENPGSAGDALRSSSVRRDIESQLQRNYRLSPKGAASAGRALWNGAAALILATVSGAFTVLVLIHTGHRFALKDLVAGIERRREVYVTRDISRMQSASF